MNSVPVGAGEVGPVDDDGERVLAHALTVHGAAHLEQLCRFVQFVQIVNLISICSVMKVSVRAAECLDKLPNLLYRGFFTVCRDVSL